MPETQSTNLAIIGAGPIGLELAIACRRAGIEYLQFDAGQIGEIISRFPAQMRFFSSPERISIAGVPIQTADQTKCTREEYLAYLRSVAMQFQLPIRTYERVVDLRREEGGFTLFTSTQAGDHRYRAERIVLSTGGTATPRPLGVPGEELPHVSHHLEDPHRYFQRRILVVGGRNSAVEAALRCWRSGATVMMCHRGEDVGSSVKYWLAPEIKHLIQTGKIEAFFNTRPVEITPTHVTLQAGEDGDEFFVPADFVLLMIGYDADMQLFEMIGVHLEGEESAPVFNPQTMETNVPGVYVAGTAVAGSQRRFAVYLENCHSQVERIVASLTGKGPLELKPSSSDSLLPEA